MLSSEHVQLRLREIAVRVFDELPLDALPPELSTSAVLLLLWPVGNGVRLALTRRSSQLRAHPGQIALPGGYCEPGEHPYDAALREAFEEIGVLRSTIEVCGRLDDAWSSTGSRVVPVVAWSETAPVLVANGYEVDEVIVVELADVLDPRNHRIKTVELGTVYYDDDVLRCGDVTIYGMTADIVIDLRDWILGTERRRVAARAEGLRSFIKHRPRAG